MPMKLNEQKSVAIAGLGSIGFNVAGHLIRGIPGYQLVAASDTNEALARQRLDDLGSDVPLCSLGELSKCADIIIECLPVVAFAGVADTVVEEGKILIPLSAAALLERMDLIDRAKQTGARILMPSGALLAFDAVRAAAEGEIQSVRMTTRKPPHTLAGAPYIEENRISLDDVREPLRVFSGSARLGAKGFPANVNVAAALSLAGIGPDRTMIEIWADPTVTRNTHEIEVEADSARFSMRIESVPSLENARTGKFTPLSVVALLRGLNATFRIGS